MEYKQGGTGKNGSLKKKKRGNLKSWRQVKMEAQIFKISYDTAKAVLRGKFIAIQVNLRKQEKSQTTKLALYLSRKRRTNKMIKMRTEIKMKQKAGFLKR